MALMRHSFINVLITNISQHMGRTLKGSPIFLTPAEQALYDGGNTL